MENALEEQSGSWEAAVVTQERGWRRVEAADGEERLHLHWKTHGW